jgi:hypothetical protein
VMDWENGIAAPWQLVECIKDLSIVSSVMDGPLCCEVEPDRERLAERGKYIEVVKEMEITLKLDSNLSMVLSDWKTLNLAHASCLYPDGRVGFYSDIFELFE